MWNQICNTVNAMYTNPIPLKSIGFTFMVPTIFGAAMRFCGSATVRVCYGQNTIKHTGYFHIFHTLENYVHTIMTIAELSVKWVVKQWVMSDIPLDSRHTTRRSRQVFQAISRIGHDNRTHNNQNNNDNRFTALCTGLPGWAGTRRNIHRPTILIIIQSLSASTTFYNL